MSTTDPTTCRHGLGPAHPWEPDRHCPPEPVEPAPDTERGERLREARKVAARARVSSVGWSPLDRRTITTLDAEVARLDAVVAAVREVHAPQPLLSGQRVIICQCCLYPHPCRTVRALDGGAA